MGIRLSAEVLLVILLLISTIAQARTSRTSPDPLPTPAYGAVRGDPHVSTYDGLFYDCQAIGEFTLSKSAANPAFEIQGRFEREPGFTVTLTSAVAIKHEDAPLLQFTIRRQLIPIVSSLGSCQVAFHVDRVLTKLEDGMTTLTRSNKRTAIFKTAKSIRVVLPSGMEVSMESWMWRNFGCSFSFVQHHIPGTVIRSARISGLLGTPNGNRLDDWTTPLNAVVPIPGWSGLLGAPAFAFCGQNWCVNRSSSSLFTYFAPTSFFTFSKCAIGTGITPNIAAVPEKVADICGKENDACLVDALEDGENGARRFREVQERNRILFTGFVRRNSPMPSNMPSREPVLARMEYNTGVENYYKMPYLGKIYN